MTVANIYKSLTLKIILPRKSLPASKALELNAAGVKSRELLLLEDLTADLMLTSELFRQSHKD